MHALSDNVIKSLNQLRQSIWTTKNYVIPFVGSGFSTGIPSWSDLLKRLIIDIPQIEQKDLLTEINKSNFIDVALYLENHQCVGKIKINKIIKELYQNPAIPRPIVYDKLVSLPFDHYLTTNYDPWLNEAYKKHHQAEIRVFGPFDEGAFIDISPGAAPFILMIHGDANKPDTCVLSHSLYRKISHGNQQWRLGMQQLIGQRSLLFLGYSISDPDINYLLDEWKEVFSPNDQTCKHFMITDNLTNLRRTKLMNIGIQPIEIGDYSLIEPILNDLSSPPIGYYHKIKHSNKKPFQYFLDRVIQENNYIQIPGFMSDIIGNNSMYRFSITDLFVPLDCQRIGDKSFANIHIINELNSHQNIVITGQPGSGKSTLIKYIAFIVAQSEYDNSSDKQSNKTCKHFNSNNIMLPLIFKAIYLTQKLHLIKNVKIKRLTCFYKIVTDLLPIVGLPILFNDFEDIIREYKIVILIDAIDEISDDVLKFKLFVLLRFIKRYTNCRIILTSRPINLKLINQLHFPVFKINSISERQIRLFLIKWGKCIRSSGIEFHPSLKKQLQSAIIEAYQDVHSPIHELVANPLCLTFVCILHLHTGKFPESTALLYQNMVSWLISVKSKIRKENGFNNDFSYRIFSILAVGMMNIVNDNYNGISINNTVNIVFNEFQNFFTGITEEKTKEIVKCWIKIECEISGIIIETDNSEIKFYHLTIQEFFAAISLSRKTINESNWWETVVLPILSNDKWYETVNFLPGCLYMGPGIDSVHYFLEKLIKHFLTPLTISNHINLIGLLARLLPTLKNYDYKENLFISQSINTIKLKSIQIITGHSKKVSFDNKVLLAEILGRLGDPRFAENIDNFIFVPGTTVCICKYPVTVNEYREFIISAGYKTKAYWSYDGWKNKQKYKWFHVPHLLEGTNRPMTGVSWYEAEAYCNWISEIQGKTIRLPNEQEWETAVLPKGCSIVDSWPWGKKDLNLMSVNRDYYEWGYPIPIGIFPDASGPLGHCNVIGSITEWSADSSETDGYRMCHGGWHYNLNKTIGKHSKYNHASACESFTKMGFRLARIII